MEDFFEKNNSLKDTEHGFQRGRPCNITNLLEYTEIISKWVDDVIYLDFQKAFDKVPHQRLLIK